VSVQCRNIDDFVFLCQAAPGKKGGAAAKAQGSKKPRDEEDDAIQSDEDAVDAQEPR
jgi:hypothetical protein